MVNFRGLFRQNYMLMIFNTVMLVIWILFLFPMIAVEFGYTIDLADPFGLGVASLSGLFFSGIIYKLLKPKLG
jgi:hypothetical protein